MIYIVMRKAEKTNYANVEPYSETQRQAEEEEY